MTALSPKLPATAFCFTIFMDRVELVSSWPGDPGSH
jgi:hypothetical protein